ncbi:hypothetical protein T484DRAFT_3225132 [Baffinella frigidus]|nr:hypothetical protein T484DRAFT_3225132 [Cryptophyta sp. CCMP2293]
MGKTTPKTLPLSLFDSAGKREAQAARADAQEHRVAHENWLQDSRLKIKADRVDVRLSQEAEREEAGQRRMQDRDGHHAKKMVAITAHEQKRKLQDGWSAGESIENYEALPSKGCDFIPRTFPQKSMVEDRRLNRMIRRAEEQKVQPLNLKPEPQAFSTRAFST